MCLCDVVSNMRLDRVLALHKERRAADKKSLLTMVLKRALPSHRTRFLQDDIMVAVDSATQELLYFDNSARARRARWTWTCLRGTRRCRCATT